MKIKTTCFLLSALVALLVIPLAGCELLQTQDSRLTSQQVTCIVLNYGVPYIDQYYSEIVEVEDYQASGGVGNVTAFGQWDAYYEGNGIWRVQGAVKSNSWGNWLTTWTLDENTGALRLIGFTRD